MSFTSPRAETQYLNLIPFDEINAAALAQYPELLWQWFPAGKISGHEFMVGDLDGTPGKSLSINIETGRWADFADGAKGGDPIGLAAAKFHDCDRVAAARGLGAQLGIDIHGKAGARNPKPTPHPLSPWMPMMPPPADAPEPTKHELGQYDALHIYRDTTGRPLFYVRRHEARGEKRKLFVPLTFGTLNGVTGWHAKHPASPRPLYGLDELAQHQNEPPILCEGEKAADAARFLFPGHACLTWPGGSGAVAQADFRPLEKLDVIVWPDNDTPGRKAAAEIVARLPQARVLDVSDLPEGHDAADILPDDPQTWLRERMPAPSDKQDEPSLRRNSAAANIVDDSFVTEDSVALAFTRAHRGDLRFCHTAGAWFRWTGAIWKKEVTRLAFDWAREIGRDLAENSGNDKVRAIAGKSAFAIGVERFSQADRAFAVTGETWDSDPWLLGTPGGTVNLKTGNLHPARQEDHITKATAVAPAERADCPQWLAFLDQATAGNQTLVGFLRRWFGYTLTGITREHALLFVFGDGGNGKGVCMNTVAGIMGDYAVNAAMDSFTASKGDKHPTDMAMLAGARMVMTTEVDEGQVWAEARLKALTGGDPITARFMRRDFFTFTPSFKLTISGNHKPQLRNVDAAARRRFNLAPFVHKPATPDKSLSEKLREEWPSILRWMIDGCLEWQHDGLQQPDVVKLATEEYFAEQNVMAQWIEECCEVGKNFADTNASLFGSWRNYAHAQSEEPRTGKWFNKALVAQSGAFESIKDKHGIRGRGFRGLRVMFDAPQGDDR